jgi:4-amino-4-deoxy-L-arabinose transferase-like glycosyltransferase
VILVVVAVMLRLICLGQNSLWVDEYASLLTARFPLSEMSSAALRGDAFEPPFYFALLHLVIACFGESEAALRSISVVSGALTVPLTMMLIRGLGGTCSAAVISGALLALHPLHLWYSQEARPYALLLCLGLASLVCLLHGWRHDRIAGWVGFAILGSLVVLTHLAGAVFPLLGFLWIVRSQGRFAATRPLWIATFAILMAIAPFGYSLAHAVAHATGTGSEPRPLTGLELPYTLFTYLGGYSFGPSLREIQNEGARAAVLHHPIQTAIAAIALVTAGALMLRSRTRVAARLALLLLLPMLIAGLGAAATGKAYNVRYAVPGVVGFVALVAFGIGTLPGARRQLVAIAFLVGVFLWSDVQWFVVPRYRKEDSRAVVAWLQANLQPGAAVAVAPAYQVPVLTYYSRREGAPLRFVGLADTAVSVPFGQVDALLLTRLHHVPHWRAILDRATARARPGVHPNLAGYEAMLLPR